jgi:NAD(P)-dependent dehydrogenase (short-subunit alcohol dehydrogenase family)
VASLSEGISSRVRGKVSLVTGAASGTELRTAKVLAQNRSLVALADKIRRRQSERQPTPFLPRQGERAVDERGVE